MRMKLFIIISLLLTATVPLFSMNGFCSPQPYETPTKATEAATEALPIFLKAIPLQELDRFNFNSPQELNRATLGEPFRIFTINPQDILSYDGQTKVSELIKAIDIWFFPVEVQGRARTLLRVEKTDEAWKAVSIGASALAREWASIEKAHPRQPGSQKTFIRIYSAVSDYVLFDYFQEGSVLVPLSSASTFEGVATGKLYPPSEALMDLKKVLQKKFEIN